MKGIEEGSCQLVVTRGDGAVDLEMADHALDAVAFAVKASVPADRGLAMGARRDGGADAILAERAADRVGIVALVGEEVDRACLSERGHGFERPAVPPLPPRKVADNRHPPPTPSP